MSNEYLNNQDLNIRMTFESFPDNIKLATILKGNFMAATCFHRLLKEFLENSKEYFAIIPPLDSLLKRTLKETTEAIQLSLEQKLIAGGYIFIYFIYLTN